ncbi:thermonuclease family protein [Teichococcus aestuarii]|uniref:thermonuclease family protein n=1 Tax=Teichococcus aestuarii TaxID=568898 RepID=UPI002481A3E3|nr:thermonuclease family protein [Pseudoroseomonas aestuarii]
MNIKLVRCGAAWVYHHCDQDPTLPPLEAEARQAKRGLWILLASEQVPPWARRRKGG